ncbi:sensor histidine kinase [Streptomyces sp. NPDC018031]|uniref:sensor histidine kinase n=1 Tax=Streptomyces sp. NPDC018031 TaxID=3365033 RepID=UPI0037B421BC
MTEQSTGRAAGAFPAPATAALEVRAPGRTVPTAGPSSAPVPPGAAGPPAGPVPAAASRLERLLRVLHRAGGDPRRSFRVDLAIAVLVLLVQTVLALTVAETGGVRPDALGWLLLTAAALPLPWRRRAPLITLALVMVTIVPYHAMGNVHIAGTCAALLALYSLAAAGPPLRTVVCVAVVMVVVAVAMILTPEHGAAVEADLLRSLGWVLAFPAFGEMVRVHRRYIAAVVERAERAERTREEEAARRVTEERLRIARDLHDLLAHSITLIGVQTSVAAHVLIADPEKLDRDTIAAALDGIADTCREARSELRTTLGVLRGGDAGQADSLDPLPRLDGLFDLARIARSAGAQVVLAVQPGLLGADAPEAAGGPAGPPGAAVDPPGGSVPGRTGRGGTGPAGPGSTGVTRAGAAPVAVPAAVGAAAYRIVQESLTNAVRHAGPEVRVRVAVHLDGTGAARALRVTVTDGGRVPGAHTAPEAPAGGGFGIAGMRERARTIGGTLETAAHPHGGFTVTALLPLDGRLPLEDER